MNPLTLILAILFSCFVLLTTGVTIHNGNRRR